MNINKGSFFDYSKSFRAPTPTSTGAADGDWKGALALETTSMSSLDSSPIRDSGVYS